MKIIQISDIHLVAPGAQVKGLDPSRRLAAVLEDIAEHHDDADLLVLTGDLADAGEPAAYVELGRLMANMPIPARFLLGNHDSRRQFRAVFPTALTDENGFLQSSLQGPDGLGDFLFLDTNEEGWSGGAYCAKRLAWLKEKLAEAGSKPVTIFMHHPPSDIGVAHFERICMSDGAPLVEALVNHPGGVRQVFIGHVHLPMCGVLEGGLPFTASRGVTHQMMLRLDARDCYWADARPSYNIILLDDRRLITHSYDMVGADVTFQSAYPPGP